MQESIERYHDYKLRTPMKSSPTGWNWDSSMWLSRWLELLYACEAWTLTKAKVLLMIATQKCCEWYIHTYDKHRSLQHNSIKEYIYMVLFLNWYFVQILVIQILYSNWDKPRFIIFSIRLTSQVVSLYLFFSNTAGLCKIKCQPCNFRTPKVPWYIIIHDDLYIPWYWLDCHLYSQLNE